MPLRSKEDVRFAPIGVFDSGFGGLTVVKEIARHLPHENLIFFGDSDRCPYGPRHPDQIEEFSLEICEWLVSLGCKLVVIACNTATAAGLAACQRAFDIPVIGVVMSGAKAAVEATHSRKVGVIATQGTISSGVYVRAIESLDSGIKVLSLATPELVDLIEHELVDETLERLDVRQALVMDAIAPLMGCDIDTLVLGCTHFPLLKDEIAACMTDDVVLVSSAEECAHEVREILTRRQELYEGKISGKLTFVTSGKDIELRNRIASRIMGFDIEDVQYKSFD